MGIKNNRVFGLPISLKLLDVPEKKVALNNLGINPDDIEIIRGIAGNDPDITTTVFDSNDLQTVSNLSNPVWKTFDRYIYDVTTYETTLTIAGGSDFQLKGNLEVAGAVKASAFRYTLFDTKSDTTPKLRWGDISTSRVSSWSAINNAIVYGGNVEIGGVLSVGKIKTRTNPTVRTFSSELPTHRIKINLNGTTRYLYAMKGIPLRFKGYFRNFDSTVTFNQISGRKVSWRVYKTDGTGTVENFADLGTNNTSTLLYRSPFPAERFIEIYYNPSSLTRLDLTGVSLRQIPRVQLTSLLTLNIFNNGLVDFPDISFFAPALRTLNISNNDFFNASNISERRFNQLIVNKLPDTLRVLNLTGCFNGGIEQNILSKFTNLESLDISRNRGYHYPDSTNPNGELPNFYGTSTDTTHKLKTLVCVNTDFRTIATSTTNTKNISELTSLEYLDLYNNYNLINTNFGISSQKLRFLRIQYTGLSGPNLSNNTAFQELRAAWTRNFGSLYSGWDGVIGSANQPTTDGGYKYANCTSLAILDLYASGVKGYVPKFIGNPNLNNINLEYCNNLIAGRPGKTTVKCLYDDTFEEARKVSVFRLRVNNADFAGEIEQNTFVPLQTTLTVVELYASGRFTGNFPDFEKCSKLSDVRSSNENWSSLLPTFTSSVNMTRIELPYNKFTGSIRYSSKNKLDYLNVTGNLLTSFDSNFYVPVLRYLYASSNQFTGKLPRLDLMCPLVEYVSLDNNQFNSYDQGFKPLRRLRQLDLSSNIITTVDVDKILYDLVDNYKLFPRRGVIVNLLGSNSAPSGYPTLTGVIPSSGGLVVVTQPTVLNGSITNLGSVGDVPAEYIPVAKTYSNLSIIYDTTTNAGSGLVISMSVNVTTSGTQITAASYSITAINNGGSGYANNEVLKTPNVIEFIDANGNVVFGHIKLRVSSTTTRVNTQAKAGVAAVSYLRSVGWTVQVNS